jgi:hypothetical protein
MFLARRGGKRSIVAGFRSSGTYSAILFVYFCSSISSSFSGRTRASSTPILGGAKIIWLG